ncbi:MAG: hypothetical protein ABSG86_14630 [Thermoguttaceae bacterium]|jgi:Flp pilus assembly pilin Flp
MLKRLWVDEGGAIISAELILVMVIVVIGMIIGLVALRDAVVAELSDVAQAISAIDASYSFGGIGFQSGSSVTLSGDFVSGSSYVDDNEAGAPDGGSWAIQFIAPATPLPNAGAGPSGVQVPPSGE